MAEGFGPTDPHQRLRGERPNHGIVQQRRQGVYRIRRPKIPEGLNGRNLEPRFPGEKRDDVFTGCRVAEVADGHDGSLYHVGVGMVEHAANRFEGPRILEVIEQHHDLEHHI